MHRGQKEDVDELGIEPKTLSSRVEDANDTLYQLSYTPDDVVVQWEEKMFRHSSALQRSCGVTTTPCWIAERQYCLVLTREEAKKEERASPETITSAGPAPRPGAIQDGCSECS
jgi:hypothetical protein